MRMLAHIFIVCSMLAFLVGCASVEKRRAYFSETQNSFIGRNIEDYWIAKPTDISYESDVIIYNYVNHEIDCKWTFVVDKERNVILRWAYISDPSNCYEQINWKGPW